MDPAPKYFEEDGLTLEVAYKIRKEIVRDILNGEKDESILERFDKGYKLQESQIDDLMYFTNIDLVYMSSSVQTMGVQTGLSLERGVQANPDYLNSLTQTDSVHNLESGVQSDVLLGQEEIGVQSDSPTWPPRIGSRIR